ncbi:MAG: outer membrane lipoprotein carrier protein LolA [Deltaproteobacteria bacterium]|nr:outer membrane lipoprotein carrier protein LolA [Deltaproteobacteria bacterium]
MNHYFVKSVQILILLAAVVMAALPAALSAESMPPLDTILKELEKRYTGSQFSADFLQESTIKSMEITDFASGRVYVRYPGMMRWEYEKPEQQAIITDGHKLWIYRPLDNQVMTGNAPVFFRDGKGASFLSDIRLIRQKFTITPHPPEGEYLYELRLVPREKTLNISQIRLYVVPRAFTIVRIVTVDDYGDDTRIDIVNPQFNVELDPALFKFDIPKGADVQKIDE